MDGTGRLTVRNQQFLRKHISDAGLFGRSKDRFVIIPPINPPKPANLSPSDTNGSAPDLIPSSDSTIPNPSPLPDLAVHHGQSDENQLPSVPSDSLAVSPDILNTEENTQPGVGDVYYDRYPVRMRQKRKIYQAETGKYV